MLNISFSLYRGKRKRIPLTVHSASHQETLEKIINGEAFLGSLKISKSRKGIWYTLISVSMDVPDARLVNDWIGVDRGKIILQLQHYLIVSVIFGLVNK